MSKIQLIKIIFIVFLHSFYGVVMGNILPEIRGTAILTVTGNITNRNQGSHTVYDMAMLEALPRKSFRTTTTWSRSPVNFEGPLLRDVLLQLGANGTQIKARALDGYRITIPVEDTNKYDLIIAIKINGQAISTRSRGPLMLVYPYDDHAELRRFKYYERSIWQLRTLDIQ